MYRTKLTTLFLFLFFSLPTFAQVTKSGSIFTDASQPRVQLPSSEAVKNIPPNTTVLRDVTYCKGGGKDLKMDAYIPKDRGANLPQALIYIHGGAWIAGDKDDGPFEQDLPELMARGFAVFSINYRLSPFNQFPAHIEDCKCAVRSLRANAAKYNVNARRIGVFGSSAGGHLATFLGTTNGISQLEGAGGYPESSSAVQAVTTYYGPADLTTSDWGLIDKLGFLVVFGSSRNWARASPINYVSRGDAPFYVIGGDRDDRVDVRQPQALFARLQAFGVPSELLIVKNSEHQFEPKGGALNPSRPEISKRVANFFDKYLRATPSAVAETLSSVPTRREVAPR